MRAAASPIPRRRFPQDQARAERVSHIAELACRARAWLTVIATALRRVRDAHQNTKGSFQLMREIRITALIGTMIAAANAGAAEIIVNANIAGSETWTSNNTYNLSTQIYVLDGATLT